FTSRTTYATARTAMLASAADLYGMNSTQQQAVAAAWTAVNVK
ncbi:M4 family metallopeptidase, partial [Streptomyces sp. 12297]